MTAGYSGTPLAAKLSLKDGQRVWWENMPASVLAEIDGHGLVLERLASPTPPLDAAMLFVTSRTELEEGIARLQPLLAPAGLLWIAWPKRASQVPTDVSEDVIRAVALPAGLVDVKVCAIDQIWSGLKLVVRKALR